MNTLKPQLREKIIQKWMEWDSRFYTPDTDFWEGMAPYWQRSQTRGGKNEKRVDTFAGYLRAHGFLQREQTVLDIGSGTGAFSEEFARTAGHVTGLDLSPLLCANAKSRADTLGLDNVDYIPCDFHVFDPEKEGGPGKYDLVFASLMPAAETYEGFRRLAALSRGGCFQATMTERSIPLLQEIAAQAVGELPENIDRKKIKFMMAFDLLYLEGMRPEVFYYETCTHIRVPANDLALAYITKMMPRHVFTAEEKEKTLRLLRDRADQDGMLSAEMNAVVGCLFWRVDREAGSGAEKS